MAIDSAEKRRSVAGIPFFLGLGVTPNASQDQEWRQQADWSYSGILADVPSVPVSAPAGVYRPRSGVASTDYRPRNPGQEVN